MGYVSERGRSALLRYQYRGRDCSLVYRYLLTPMNNVLIHWIPMWMAPNLVTVRTTASRPSAPPVNARRSCSSHLSGRLLLCCVGQVTGVAAALVAYATLAWWCPALTCGTMPGWLYVLDAACTFIYQVRALCGSIAATPLLPELSWNVHVSARGHACSERCQSSPSILNPREGPAAVSDARRCRACSSRAAEAWCGLGWSLVR